MLRTRMCHEPRNLHFVTLHGVLDWHESTVSRLNFPSVSSRLSSHPTEVPMRRIGLAAVLGLSLTLAPLDGEAQQAGKVYQVGYLGIVPPTASNSAPWDAFVDGLREYGYVEGRNLVLHRRYSAGQDTRFAELAAELVRLNVDVIVSRPPTERSQRSR